MPGEIIDHLKIAGYLRLGAGAELTTEAGAKIDLSNAVITFPAGAVFQPDANGAAGAAGLVPAPAAGDAQAKKFLTARGTWDNPDPITTAGDLIVGGTGGVPARLAKGDNGQVLTMAGGIVSWQAGGAGGGGGSGGAVTPTIIQRAFGRGSNPQIVVPGAPAAGNLLVLIMVGYSGATGSTALPAGWTLLYSGSPVSAQSAWVAYRVADGTEGTPTYGFSYGDNANLAYFEVSSPFNITASCVGGNYNSGNGTLPAACTASFAGSLRLVAVEWDNSVNVTGVSSGGTLEHAWNDGANHRGAIARTTGSPLVPLVFALDGGPDRPEVLVVEIAGA